MRSSKPELEKLRRRAISAWYTREIFQTKNIHSTLNRLVRGRVSGKVMSKTVHRCTVRLCAVALCCAPLSAFKASEPIHFFIDQSLLDKSGDSRPWENGLDTVVQQATDTLCRAMNSAEKTLSSACEVEFNRVIVSPMADSIEKDVRDRAEAGAPLGSLGQQAVEYLLGLRDPAEHRIYVVPEIRSCAGIVISPSQHSNVHIAGCSHSFGNTLIAIGGLEDLNAARLVANTHTVLHELGHQVDLYDREQAGYLMYRFANPGTKLDPGESGYFQRLLPMP